MKKKLLAVISLLVALVMSFTLIACGDKTGSGKGADQNKVLTDTKLETAVGNIQNAKTLELDISGSVDSAETDAEEFSAKLVLSGNKAKYTDPTTELSYIVDMDTGYCYFESDEQAGKYYFDPMLPSGLGQYADDVMNTLIGEAGGTGDVTVDYAAIAEKFTYDETYGGFVATLEAKEPINAAIKFVQDAYADDASLNDVIDSLLQKATGEQTVTLEALVDLACSEQGFGAVKNVPISALLGEDGDALFEQVFALLGEAGVELTAQQKAAIKNRKVGELLAGGMAALNDILESGSFEDIDPEAVLSALFFDEVTPAQVESAALMLSTYADMAIDFLKDAKVRDLVDEKAPDAVKAVIKSNFAFNAISLKAGFKLDGKNISEFMLEGYVEHNYSGAQYADLEFIGDNEYKATVTVGITAKNTETVFDVDFADDADLSSGVFGIIRAYDNKNTEIYFETCGKTVAASDFQAMYMTADGDRGILDADGIAFVPEKSRFVIPAELGAEVADACGNDSATVTIRCTLTVDGQEDEGYIICVVVPDASVETFAGVVVGLIEQIM